MTISHPSQTNMRATSSSKPISILIVEDEGIVGLDIQRRLTNLGYHAQYLATSGNQAIQRALNLRPDLVLMDIRLKGDMDGIRTAEQIRVLLDIPVIFISAYADEDTLRRAKVTEPYAYILKPFEEREIHIAIEIALYKHQMNRKLKESERWLATTLNNIDDGVITTSGDGQINLINPVATVLTGWTESEALGQPLASVWQIRDERTQQIDLLLVPELLAGRKLAVAEPVGLLVSRTGDEFPIQYHAKVILGEAEQMLGLVISFRDLRSVRQNESTRQRIQQLEVQQELSKGIAHEFANISNALLAELDQLKTSVANDEQQGPLARLEKGLLRNASLSQQLAQLPNKAEVSGRFAYNLTAHLYQLVDLLFTVPDFLVDFQVEATLWPVELELSLVSHAFYQLLLNAKEAMAAGGCIRLSGSNLLVQAATDNSLPPGPYLKLIVQDSGMGIASSDLPHIFAEDFTTKPNHSGKGLATVQQILQQLGGQVTIQSVLDQGTYATLYLPAVPHLTVSPGGTNGLADTIAPQGRILVMDDEELIREATSALLDYLGYTYEMAKDGAEAVERYQNALHTTQPFDVVILDLTVHDGMGGQQALEELRALDPQVKAIVSSGYFHDPVVANYQNYGFRGVVSKPYTIDAMSETLHRLIQLDDTPKTT